MRRISKYTYTEEQIPHLRTAEITPRCTVQINRTETAIYLLYGTRLQVEPSAALCVSLQTLPCVPLVCIEGCGLGVVLHIASDIRVDVALQLTWSVYLSGLLLYQSV